MRRARTIRKSRGESLDDVMNATGLDKGALSKFERGLRDMQYHNLTKLAGYYGVRVETLMKENGHR